MANTIADREGGPAFPVSPELVDRLGCYAGQPDAGLTKREWYAGQALIGLASRSDLGADDMVVKAFELADGMMEERCI